MAMEKKAWRKTKRALEIVEKDYRIKHSEKPTEHLLICNAGLVTGTWKEDLAECFIPFGEVQSLLMLPGKSYSFVSFIESTSAQAAYAALNGKVGLSDNPLYLTYIDSIPNTCENDLWEKPLPDGLRIVEDFVSPVEEDVLLNSIQWPTSPATKEALKHRQVLHFGYEFEYGTNTINPDKPIDRKIPQECEDLVLKRCCSEGLISESPDQLTANRYEPGQGIPPHIDTHSCCTDTILSLSLGSDVVMNFVDQDDESFHRPVVLPRRSMLIMSGRSRYAFTHGITPRSTDIVPAPGSGITLRKRGLRVSLTFRKVLRGPCACSFPRHCDSQQSALVTIDEDMAKKLEATHVHSVYEKIADHFSETRHKPWPKVMEFLGSLPPSGTLIDIGCGNGKYLGHHKGQLQIGCDYSNGLVSICHDRGLNAVRSDCLSLPFKDAIADGFISIAVIHHLSTKERRRRALLEMKRILKPGGRGLIYAWAQEQEMDSVQSTYLKQRKKPDGDSNESNMAARPLDCGDTQMPLVLPVHKNRTNFEHADLLVPWKKKANVDGEQGTFHRFYHVFKEGEVEDLIESVEGLEILQSYYDQGNWCVIMQRQR